MPFQPQTRPNIVAGRVRHEDRTVQTSPTPVIVTDGAYQPVVLHVGIAYVNGQLPRQHGKLRWTGKVGSELDLEQARQAARSCAVCYLLALEEALGGLQRVERLFKVTGYVASTVGFVQQPAVIDAVSEYFDEVLGARGNHARAAVGVVELPRGAMVEMELITAVRP